MSNLSAVCQIKSIEKVYDVKKQVQCIAMNNSSRMVAVGCVSELKIFKIEGSSLNLAENYYCNTQSNSTITDISWAPRDSGRVALALSSGSIMVVNTAIKGAKMPQLLRQEWSSGKISSCVNKVTWHPNENNVVASANQDGHGVKIFDIRQNYSGGVVQSRNYGNRSALGTKDVQFDPFHSDIFAEATENGSLKIWDRRMLDKPIMSKSSAHTFPILSLAWSPSTEWILATGSKDKSVKIWDLNSCSIINTSSSNNNTNNTNNNVLQQQQSNTNLNTSTHGGGGGVDESEPLFVKAINTSSPVGKVSWRGSEECYNHQIITSSCYLQQAQLVTDNTANNSNISIWDIQFPNTPICILKGHDHDVCASFDWLDGIPVSKSSSSSTLHASNNNISTNSLNQLANSNNNINSISNTNLVGLSSKNKRASQRNKSNKSPIETSNSSSNLDLQSLQQQQQQQINTIASKQQQQRNSISSFSQDNSNNTAGTTMNNSCKYIISGTRDGKIIIHNPLYGIFPYDSISSSVTTISNQGHVAFHRGDIPKSLKSDSNGSAPLRLSTNKDHIEDTSGVNINATTGNSNSATALNSSNNNNNNNSNVRNSITLSNNASANPLAYTFLDTLTSLNLINNNTSNTNANNNNNSNTASSTTQPSFLQSVRKPSYHDVSNESKSNNNTSSNSNSSSNNNIELHTGAVYVGLADINNLNEAKRIHSIRGAEGGVFDPALINLLARSYCLAHNLHDETEDVLQVDVSEYYQLPHNFHDDFHFEHYYPISTVTMKYNDYELQEWNNRKVIATKAYNEWKRKHINYKEALRACAFNKKVAQSAGLTCRASLWASLLALLPAPSSQFTLPMELLTPLLTKKDSLTASTTSAMTSPKSPNKLSLLVDNFPPIFDTNNNNNTSLNGGISTSTLLLSSIEQWNHSELPFAIDIIANIVSELLEGGDSQHFVAVCEILRKVQLLSIICQREVSITEEKVRRVYLAYLDLLNKLQLFTISNEIIKSSDDTYISTLSRKGVLIHIKCAKCGKELTENTSTAWCLKCTRCVGICVLCYRPVRGLFHWCPVCGHGGHMECTKKWFSQSIHCPSGCGHDCCSSFMNSSNHNSNSSNNNNDTTVNHVNNNNNRIVHGGGNSANALSTISTVVDITGVIEQMNNDDMSIITPPPTTASTSSHHHHNHQYHISSDNNYNNKTRKVF